jgi:lysophospholipase L1-like esterase
VSACRLGVLALGDSITNGGGELQWGVALQSWALWLARGLGLPYSPHAVDGARVEDVLRGQVPAVGDGRYDLGCLYIGVNDVRALDWERERFERGHSAVLAFLRERCDRLLTLTVPLDLGRPRAGAKVAEVNAAIEASARAAGALVLDLRGFGGRNLLMADHVHPTALGQIAIAERALDVLAADGLPPRLRPSSLIHYETTRVGRLRGDLTYAYRHAKISARAFAAARLGRLPSA